MTAFEAGPTRCAACQQPVTDEDGDWPRWRFVYIDNDWYDAQCGKQPALAMAAGLRRERGTL